MLHQRFSALKVQPRNGAREISVTTVAEITRAIVSAANRFAPLRQKVAQIGHETGSPKRQ
jgi:hypothetical protein